MGRFHFRTQEMDTLKQEFLFLRYRCRYYCAVDCAYFYPALRERSLENLNLMMDIMGCLLLIMRYLVKL